MRNIKLTIEYDGTHYHGWQSQINALAIQDVIQRAVEKLTNEKCSLTGASRTDVGVHAYGQTANFMTSSKIPADKFSFALNNLLPEDIVIRESVQVVDNFHSRYWAKGKKYRYLFYNAPFRSPIFRNRAFRVHRPLDFDAMQEAAGFMVGKHDFTAFMASGGSVKTTERTITQILLSKKDEVIELEVIGDGFLYNMVRIIAGTLADVGIGRIGATEIPEILKGLDRAKAGRTAPSHGLYLVEVYYEQLTINN
jgi:tRNA pseudouridine38-40 synthase